jgi:hypothetical protein
MAVSKGPKGRSAPRNRFPQKGGLNPVKRPQDPPTKIVQSHPDATVLFEPYPGMAGMKVISLGDLHPFGRQQFHRPHDGVYGELILEKLIKLTIPAVIIVGACPEIDACLHGVNTGLLPGRTLAKDVLPKYQVIPSAEKGLPVVPAAIIFLHNLSQDPVKPAFMTPVVKPAHLFPNRPRLHPDAFGTASVLSKTLYTHPHKSPRSKKKMFSPRAPPNSAETLKPLSLF